MNTQLKQTKDIKKEFETSYFNDTILASKDELVKLYGEPNGENDDKSTYKWVVERKSADYHIATIYDYKEGEKFSNKEMIHWHIGAKNKINSEVLTAIISNDLINLRNEERNKELKDVSPKMLAMMIDTTQERINNIQLELYNLANNLFERIPKGTVIDVEDGELFDNDNPIFKIFKDEDGSMMFSAYDEECNERYEDMLQSLNESYYNDALAIVSNWVTTNM